ncbi:MAG: TonB-dependent receptor plug domain-containing protein, partial [Caulobacterales bacterium]
MSKRTILATTSAVVCAIFGAASAGAQEAGAPAETAPSEEIVVVGDRVGLLETTPSSTVFGLGMSLLETPRSATMVSDTTLERYGIEEVDDLISISPGTFTASFYGVKGAVNTRGTLAESYFRGFKRIENRGTYPTPLGATSQVELVRGPPSPLYGAGKVGGLLNIVPRTAQADGGTAYIDEIEGDLEVTVGSYGKFNAAGGMGIPLTFGSVEGGLFGYLEIEDSDSYYRGMHPEHQLLQLSSDFDLTPTLTMSMGLMMYRAEGYVQTPGWNRLTQDLIDNQNYIIGQDTTLVDTNGDGRLQPSEVSGGTLVSYYFGGPPGAPPARFTLDTPGAGTTVKLDPRTIYISDRDFSETDTNTFYFELSKEIGVNTLSFEMFYDDLLNDRFVSYGFPAHYDSSVYEARLHYDFELGNEDSFFHANSTAGVSYRNVNALRMETYNSGYIALDRRDLSVGATPTDIMDDPFSTDGGLGWDIAVDTNTEDTGLFALSNMTFGGLINLLIGGRMDWYDVTTINRGPTCFCGVDNVYVSADADEFSWNGSLSINAPFGLFPYYTYA